MGTLPLLQLQSFITDYAPSIGAKSPSANSSGSGSGSGSGGGPPQVQLSSLLTAIKTGRVLLLNMFQMLAFGVIATIGMGSWSMALLGGALAAPEKLTSLILPPLDLILLLAVVELPLLLLSLLLTAERGDDAVMRRTPRKRGLVRKQRYAGTDGHW